MECRSDLLYSNVTVMVDCYKHLHLSSSWEQAGTRGRAVLRSWSSPQPLPTPALPCLGLGHLEVSSLSPYNHSGLLCALLLESPSIGVSTMPFQAVLLGRVLSRKLEACCLSPALSDILTNLPVHTPWSGGWSSLCSTDISSWPLVFKLCRKIPGNCPQRNPGSQIFLRCLFSLSY